MSATEAEVEAVKIDNPYWEEVKDFPEPDFDWGSGTRQLARWNDTGKPIEYGLRDRFVKRYSWSVPDPEAIEFIVEHLDGRAVVEIGAGTGYWAYLLNQAGVQIDAYDIEPVPLGENNWHPKEDAPVEWYPVRQGNENVLSLPEYHDRTLLLSWPPYDKPMASDALKLYRGKQLIYIGEWRGCTGDKDFHDMLDPHDEIEVEWQQTGRCRLVQWEGMHDRIYVFERA